MLKEEAKARQERLKRDGYDLGSWYGTRCEKCCEVYPELIVPNQFYGGCYYRCPVCGKRTEEKPMPWVSEEAWNKGEFVEEQIRMF